MAITPSLFKDSDQYCEFKLDLNLHSNPAFKEYPSVTSLGTFESSDYNVDISKIKREVEFGNPVVRQAFKEELIMRRTKP